MSGLLERIYFEYYTIYAQTKKRLLMRQFSRQNGIIPLKDKEELNTVECLNDLITQGQKSDLKLDFNSINQSFEKNSDT